MLMQLTAAERSRLASLHAKLLGGVVDSGARPANVCRLCDAEGCGHYEGIARSPGGRSASVTSAAPPSTSMATPCRCASSRSGLLGPFDPVDEPALLAVRESLEELLGAGFAAERLRQVARHGHIPGSASSSISTSTVSPAAAPALSRFAALTPIRYLPPRLATVLR